MKKLFSLIVSLVFFTGLCAQYFQTGQDPASIKWRQINTENFQLIYPDYYENQAQKLAGMMEIVYQKGGATLNYKPRKISIILHTQTVKSNGLVAWAPKRVEFYTIPHQENYAQNWLEQLAIHEFRHVVQIDKVNSEIPKIIKILLGEQGTALIFGAYIPWWFIEGDAVVTETAFSNSGRGRFPSFLVEHKALAIEKGNYKYDKAYNSSYRDYVPNHYQLGYYLVGSARERYGTELWSSMLKGVGSRPFSLSPFNRALRKNIGMTKVQLYNSVFDSLKSIWEIDDNSYTSEKFRIFTPSNKTYTNYRYNHWFDGTVVSYKTALNQIPSFVRIFPNGSEKKIHQPGTIFNESVNYRGEWIVWSEQIPDPRWQHSGKSIIRLLNLFTNEKRRFITDFTAFAPSISPDKKNIVVVESDFSSNYYISVYQISDGKLVDRFQTENNNYFFSPDWLNDNEIITVMLSEARKVLCKINFHTNNLEILTDENLGEIKNLKVINNAVYFVGSYTGKDALYRYDIDDKSLILMYEPRFGLESPAISLDQKKIIVSDLTSDGLRLLELTKNDLKTKALEKLDIGKYDLAEKLAVQESGIIDFSGIDTVIYKSKKYSKPAHLFNFHSWAPAAIDVNNYEFVPGVSFLSQNKLGTAEINVGYKWKMDEKAGIFYGKYTYKGWYPIFDFEINTGKSAINNYNVVEQVQGPNGAVISNDTIQKRVTWNETNFGADVRIPFNLTRGRFNRYLQPELKYNFTLYKSDSSTPEHFFAGNYQSLSYRLYYQQFLKQSYQDVFPNFGFAADLIYQNSPAGDADLGNLFLAESYLFLPGILQNHGIRLYSGLQDKNGSKRYSFSESIRYPRGWGKINTARTYSFAFDYKLPLFYPEWNVGSLVYLQRVKSSFFADFANLNGYLYDNGNIVGTFSKNISSFGIEITGDANFLRFYAPVEIGFRASYLPEEKGVFYNFLFSIDFNSL